MKNILLALLILTSSIGYSQTKLYKDTSVVITATEMRYPGGVIPFVIDTTGKPTYADFTSLENIATYGERCVDYKWVRNTIITDYLPSWDSLTLEQQQILVSYNINPDSTSTTELDLIYTLPKRNKFRDHCMESLDKCDCIVIKANENKYYHQKIDTNAVISNTEITTYQTVND